MPSTKHHILVVDDDPICLKLLESLLGDAGYETSLAASGREAWSQLSLGDVNYSVILLDRIMMDVDGMELLDKVKNSPAHRHIPVIMMTGEAERDEVINAVRGGVFDFIFKPVDSEVLIPLINRALNHFAAV